MELRHCLLIIISRASPFTKMTRKPSFLNKLTMFTDRLVAQRPLLLDLIVLAQTQLTQSKLICLSRRHALWSRQEVARVSEPSGCHGEPLGLGLSSHGS